MMKGLKKSSILLIMLFILIFSATAFANGDLTITNWTTDAELIDNGDLNIKEDLEFDFDGDFNGVFRTITLKDIDKVDNISVMEIGSGKEYTQALKAKNGDTGVFTVKEDQKNLEIKIYSPSEGQKKIFRISYRVVGVPIKYTDTAELNYNFIGSENETYIDKFSAVLKMPFPFTPNRVKIFGHGPLQGNVDYLGDDSIKIEVDNIDGGKNVTLRTLFPTRFIKNSTNVRNEMAFDRIMNEETKLIAKVDKSNSLKDSVSKISLYIGAGVTALVALLMFLFRRKKTEKSIGNMRVESLMESSTPAMVSIVVNSLITDKTITATLLDLARKGYIDIKEDERVKESAIIIRKREADERLTESEQYFLTYFLNTIGDGKIVSTEKIKKYSDKNKDSYAKFITKWTEQVKDQMESEGYYDKRDKKRGSIIMVSFVILLITSFILFVYVGDGRMANALLLVVMSFVGLFYGIYVYSRKSSKGYEESKVWNAFKVEMNSIKKQEQKENRSLKEILKYPLEASLIYSIALGVKEDIIDTFKSEVQEDQSYYMNSSASPWLFWYVLYGGNFNKDISQSVTNSTPYSGSSVGAGGGFSGGGGGAGGGGAGGF